MNLTPESLAESVVFDIRERAPEDPHYAEAALGNIAIALAAIAFELTNLSATIERLAE